MKIIGAGLPRTATLTQKIALEMLGYAPDLRSITGGRGDYTLEFLRYEEVPSQLAQKLVAQAGAERAAAQV